MFRWVEQGFIFTDTELLPYVGRFWYSVRQTDHGIIWTSFDHYILHRKYMVKYRNGWQPSTKEIKAHYEYIYDEYPLDQKDFVWYYTSMQTYQHTKKREKTSL